MQVGMTMMADYFLGEGASEEDELSIEEAVLDLSPAAEAEESAGDPRSGREPLLRLSASPTDRRCHPGAPARRPPSGAGFERSVEAMLRRGTVPGLPAMDSVIYGQYNPQGHGVDLFGIRIVGNRLDFLTASKSRGAGARRSARQPAVPRWRAWLDPQCHRPDDGERAHPEPVYARGSRHHAQLRARLRRAPARVVLHASAFLGFVGPQVGGLRSRNRDARLIHRVGRRRIGGPGG